MTQRRQLSARIPWWAKLGTKVALSQLPVDYQRWRGLPVFRHGAMEDSDYALRVFRTHVERTIGFVEGRTVLELGPGDSVATAVCAAAYGAARIYLVDAGRPSPVRWCTR